MQGEYLSIETTKKLAKYDDLQQRIDKAIQRIEKFRKDEGLSMYVDTGKHLDIILDILKGIDIDE